MVALRPALTIPGPGGRQLLGLAAIDRGLVGDRVLHRHPDGMPVVTHPLLVPLDAVDHPVTPEDARAVSWHGLMHFVSSGIGFLSLIAACFVVASLFAALCRRGWAAYSVATGLVFLAGFVGIA